MCVIVLSQGPIGCVNSHGERSESEQCNVSLETQSSNLKQLIKIYERFTSESFNINIIIIIIAVFMVRRIN